MMEFFLLLFIYIYTIYYTIYLIADEWSGGLQFFLVFILNVSLRFQEKRYELNNSYLNKNSTVSDSYLHNKLSSNIVNKITRYKKGKKNQGNFTSNYGYLTIFTFEYSENLRQVFQFIVYSFEMLGILYHSTGAVYRTAVASRGLLILHVNSLLPHLYLLCLMK